MLRSSSSRARLPQAPRPNHEIIRATHARTVSSRPIATTIGTTIAAIGSKTGIAGTSLAIGAGTAIIIAILASILMPPPRYLFGFAIEAMGSALSAGATNSHVAACEHRFRSYDRSSDTYLGYDGKRHYCRL